MGDWSGICGTSSKQRVCACVSMMWHTGLPAAALRSGLMGTVNQRENQRGKDILLCVCVCVSVLCFKKTDKRSENSQCERQKKSE